MPTHLSKTELATILSALDGQTRYPANRDKALAALERRAAALGLTTDEILDAAPGLLDGRLSPEDWLAEITDAGQEKVETVTAEVVAEVKAVLIACQERKREELRHDFLGETATIGLLPHLQAQLLARHLRGDLDGYPPFVWK